MWESMSVYVLEEGSAVNILFAKLDICSRMTRRQFCSGSKINFFKATKLPNQQLQRRSVEV